MALQGNSHELNAAIAVATVLVVFRYAILRLVLGVIAATVIAGLVYGTVLLAHDLRV